MFRRMHGRVMGCAAAALAAIGTVGAQEGYTSRHGNSYSVTQAPNDLFYNYHSQPGWGGGYTAGMYPAPMPVPGYVGQTYYTYQPLYPHHYLEAHKLHYTDGDRDVRVKYSHHGGQIWRYSRWTEQRWQPRYTFPAPVTAHGFR